MKQFPSEKEQEAMEATTAATSAIDDTDRKAVKKGCSIAPE